MGSNEPSSAQLFDLIGSLSAKQTVTCCRASRINECFLSPSLASSRDFSHRLKLRDTRDKVLWERVAAGGCTIILITTSAAVSLVIGAAIGQVSLSAGTRLPSSDPHPGKMSHRRAGGAMRHSGRGKARCRAADTHSVFRIWKKVPHFQDKTDVLGQSNK
jgi:hypothetical protein